MNPAQRIRGEFGDFEFGPPCSIDDLRRAETGLGEPLPDSLREFYLAFDGFRGPTQAQFFWPLFAENGLVNFNRFLRRDDLFLQTFVSSCVFFGDAGVGDMWGIKRDQPGKVIRWSAAWGDDFEVAGESPLEVWLCEKKTYDQLDSKKA